MSNNDLDNDLEVENFEDAGFDDFNKKGSLGDLWRNNPMVKIGVILAGVALVVGAIILFGGSAEKLPQSQLASPSEVKEAPGSSEISATMEQSIQDKNMQIVEDATRTGGSAVPIPTQPSKGTVPVPADEAAGEDPLERWRRMQEERIRQQEMLAQVKPQTPDAAPPVDTKTPAVNAMAQSMSSQMQAILQNQRPPKVGIKQITDVGFLEELDKKKNAQFQQAQAMSAANTNSEAQVENIIVPAGTIEYGQFLIEANTDAPGPVIAQIISGPLRGGRVLGAFTSTDKYLTVTFSTVVIDGIDYPIEAIAIDPDTTLPGVITDIDNHYFKRIVLPMASEFISGLASAISESGTTSVFISDSSVTQSTSDKSSDQEVATGVNAAGEKISEFIDEEADRTKPTLRVATGTPIGILFLRAVTDTNLSAR